MTELLERYQCSSCLTLHETSYRAEECCPIEVAEILVCPICEEEFDNDRSGRKEGELHLKDQHSGESTAEEKYFEMLRSGPVRREVREKILNDSRTPERLLIDRVIFGETV